MSSFSTIRIAEIRVCHGLTPQESQECNPALLGPAASLSHSHPAVLASSCSLSSTPVFFSCACALQLFKYGINNKMLASGFSISIMICRLSEPVLRVFHPSHTEF